MGKIKEKSGPLQDSPVTIHWPSIYELMYRSMKEAVEVLKGEGLEGLQLKELSKCYNSIQPSEDIDSGNELNSLPRILFPGMFNNNGVESICTEASGLAVLSIAFDSENDRSRIEEKLSDKHVVLWMRSPINTGYIVVFYIPSTTDNSQYKEYGSSFLEYIQRKLGDVSSIKYESIQDISWPFPVTYDPDLYFNFNADIWSPKVPQRESVAVASAPSVPMPNKPILKNQISSILNEVGLDIAVGKLFWEEIENKVRNRKLVSLSEAETIVPYLPVRKQMLGPFLYTNSHALLIGEYGSGKSWLALQIANAVAGGEKSFLGYPIEANGNVIYLDTEMGLAAYIQRYTLMDTNHADPKGEIQYLSMKGVPLDDFGGKIRELVEECNPVMIILDNLKSTFGEIEWTKGGRAATIMQTLTDLAREVEALLLTVTHTSKHNRSNTSTGDLASGTGALNDLVDNTILLRKTKNPTQKILIQDKARFTPEMEYGVIIQMDEANLQFNTVGKFDKKEEWKYLPKAPMASTDHPLSNKDREKIVAQYHMEKGKMNQTEVANLVGVSPRTIRNWQKDWDIPDFLPANSDSSP